MGRDSAGWHAAARGRDDPHASSGNANASCSVFPGTVPAQHPFRRSAGNSTRLLTTPALRCLPPPLPFPPAAPAPPRPAAAEAASAASGLPADGLRAYSCLVGSSDDRADWLFCSVVLAESGAGWRRAPGFMGFKTLRRRPQGLTLGFEVVHCQSSAMMAGRCTVITTRSLSHPPRGCPAALAPAAG